MLCHKAFLNSGVNPTESLVYVWHMRADDDALRIRVTSEKNMDLEPPSDPTSEQEDDESRDGCSYP